MKYLLTIPLVVFMITSVMAVSSERFSITADDKFNSESYGYIAHFTAWHDDGRAPTYNPNKWFNHADGTRTHYSNGIPPSGKGTFEISVYQGRSLVSTLTLNFEEKSVISNSNGVVVIKNSARGYYWIKGAIPIKVDFNNLKYTYDKNTDLVTIEGNEMLGLYVPNLTVN